ncbi:Jag N-terminal domain-containing protein [Arcobacter sp. YIC-464]|uniref:Jag N-terminal domain-containing protein n=1 Tax=Arcobacter sp. YIC-464 TaxID=3376631 RepID=UPI003C17642D
MKKFEAKCLEEVYELATADFNCSITDLEIEIIQQPSKGFLGFGKKKAIIQVCYKQNCKTYEKSTSNNSFEKKDIKIEEVSKKIEDCNKPEEKEVKEEVSPSNVRKVESKEKIFDNFYNEDESQTQVSNIIVKKDKQEILDEVRAGINTLFGDSCYGIENIKIEFYDEETLYIEFTGEDSALLIGKEGYRYKALSYILFNWINEKYGLMLRLEVAEFLKNQEAAIHAYLEPVIETIKEKGMFKTKPLDGILVHIALKRLRDEFPDKYVAVKTNVRGDKYVLVNEYRSKEQ